MASRFWVGGSGNWDGSDTSHWSATTGGSSGASVPTSSDDVTFDSNSGTAATVTITGATANANTITINKSDLTLLHNAGSTVVGAVTLTTGTLNANGQTCNWGKLISSNSSARTLTMGSSAITLTSTGTAWDTSTFTNLTVTTNTSTVTLNGATSTWFGGSGFNTNGGSIVMAGSGVAIVANTFTCKNLTRTGTAAKTDTIQFNGGSSIVTGTLTITGNSVTNRVLATSLSLGSAATVSAASVSLTNVDFRDINASGAAIPFTGTSLGNCLGNSNITFDTSVTQTWQGTSGGNWSDVSKWTSRVPLPQDNVVISSAFSASQTVTGDMPRLGKDINWTGSSGSPTWSVTATAFMYGSLNLTNVGTVNGGTTFTLAGRSSHTITSAGKSMALFGQVAAPGATYSLQDALQMNNLVTVGSGLVFETNSYNVTIGNYQINNGATVNMGTGTWTLTGTLVSPSAVWNVTSTGAVVNSSSATIVITTTTSSSRTFNGADKTYGTLTYTLAGSTGNLIITGSNTFGTINFSDSSNARTLQFTSGTTTTITGAFNVNGTSGKLMTINSSTGGSAATLSKSSGTVSCDYLSIQDSTATGGAAWYAGANSTNVSGNTGWIFTAPANGAWFDIL